MIVTFYSFKGGVGRSMAMVNVAEILAERGYRVLLCDWDLEAPGLENYLVDVPRAEGAGGRDLPALEAEYRTRTAELRRLAEEYRKAPGIMDLLTDYKRELRREGGVRATPVAATHRMVGELMLQRPSSCAVPVPSRRAGRGELRLLTAGRRDGEANDRYTQLVREFDWAEFYDQWGGAAYFEFFRKDLEQDADIVLIDSRTGVTEQGGVCTHHLADLVVLLSAPNDLNLDGTKWMADKLKRETLVQLRGGRRLDVLPIAARVEVTAETDRLALFQNRFVAEFSRYLPPKLGARADFLKHVQIPYVPVYSLEERVVAREHPGGSAILFTAYSDLAETVLDYGVESGMLTRRESGPHRAARVLDRAARDYTPPPGRFFISYSLADAAAARALAEGLRSVDVDVWIDQLSPGAGDSWDRTLDRVLAGCTGFVIVVGLGGLDERAKAEMNYALRLANRGSLRIVPALVAGADASRLPSALANWNAVRLAEADARDMEYFRRLATELGVARTVPTDDRAAALGLGLRPFGEQDSLFYFGRDEVVAHLVRGLGPSGATRLHWLHLEGPPGAGKTSLVFAGLVPAIRRGAIAGSPRDWRVAQIAIGADPVAGLAWALADASLGEGPETIVKRLRQSPDALAELVGRELSGGRGVLLVLDGLEQLLLTGDPEDVRQLDALLHGALRRLPPQPFYLITTLRSDATARLGEMPLLADALKTRAKRHWLDPMSRDELRTALLGFAQAAGVTWEPSLLEHVLDDVGTTPARMSLVGAILERLYPHRSGTQLTYAAYAAFGGASAVVAEFADRAIQALDPTDRDRARRLLVSLVTETGTIRTVPRADALAAAGGGADADRVAEALVEARLIARDKEDRVTIAHETLWRDWPTLQQWVSEEREHLQRRQEVDAAANSWVAAGKPPEGLPRGRLREYYDRAGAASSSTITRDYLATARRQQRRRETRAIAIAIAAGFVVFFVVAGAMSLNRAREAAQTALRAHTDSTLVRLRRDSLARRADTVNAWAAGVAAEADRAPLAADTLPAPLARAVGLQLRAREAAASARLASYDALEATSDLAARAERELDDARAGRDSLIEAMRKRNDSLTTLADSLSARARTAQLRADSVQAQLVRTRQAMRDSIRIAANLTAAGMADSLLKLVREAQGAELNASRRVQTLQAERDGLQRRVDSLAYQLGQVKGAPQRQQATPP